MKKTRSLYSNIIFNLIKTLCRIIFPIITLTYATRILGAEGIGKVNFAKSFVTYFISIATLGVNYYGAREGARIRENQAEFNKFAQEMLVINIASTVISYLLLFLIWLSVGKLHDYTFLIIIYSFSISLSGLGFEWVYTANEEFKYIAIRGIIVQVVSIVGMFAFVRDRYDVIPYSIVLVIASYGPYICNIAGLRKRVCFKKSHDII